MKRTVPVALIALFVTVPGASSATEPEPPPGCFCLAEARSPLPQVQRGCRRTRGVDGETWLAICAYIDTRGALQVSEPITLTEDWEIVLPDDDPCVPCAPRARDHSNVIRGDGDSDSDSEAFE